MREEKQTFVEMMIGIALSSLIITVVGAIIVPNKLSFVFGTLFGGAIAVFVLFLMYRSIEKALSMDEKNAESYTTKTAIYRLAIMASALVIGILCPKLINVIGVLLGLFTLKVSAYLQPLVHKVFANKI